ncbi:hypothetical protein Tco_0354357 [Tanacetum coccineum]
MHKPLKSHLKIALEAFVDADWAKCVVTRKSVTGFCIKLNEIVWILKILNDLNWEHFMPVNMFCDSQAAIKIAANPVFHERTKHLEIDLHFVREKILSGFEGLFSSLEKLRDCCCQFWNLG